MAVNDRREAGEPAAQDAASAATSRVVAGEVAATLRDAILRGDVQPGERLESERRLAERLGVSRGSVREALKQLDQLGLLDIRHGGGARVRPLEEASLDVVGHLLALEGGPGIELVTQLLDVHEILMISAVELAVRNATDDELSRARELLGGLEDPGLGDAGYRAALDELGQLISKASRNLVLRLVRNGLRAVFVDRDSGARLRARHAHQPPRSVVSPLARRISEALAVRDADEAQDGVRLLLRAHREQLLKRLEQRTPRRDRPSAPRREFFPAPDGEAENR
jgi:DNA-binding FadR family transcriptional regulator